MKKNEDIKRHLRGEKTVLKAGHWISSKIIFPLILLIFLFLQEIFPQIPINGFCSLNDFHVPKGYEKILSAELIANIPANNEELILYSPSLKKICIFISSQPDSNLKNYNFYEFETAFEISQLKELKDKNPYSKRFVYTSRKNRTAGIFEIRHDTLKKFIPPLFESQITFDYYPEDVNTADINGDGKEEILVSGSGFDGISILFRTSNRFAEKKIVAGSSFKETVFVDLNNDGLKDIAGFNLIDNTLQFFYNDRKNNFKHVRTFHPGDRIELLRTYDIDKDGFSDIIYYLGKSLQIMLGDFQSSYNNKITLELDTKPDAIQFADYNEDKYTDIAYLDKQVGSVSILFGKTTGKFYDEITYAGRNSLSSIATFQNKKKNSLAYLTNDGLLSTISSYKSAANPLKIVPAVSPGAIKNFDFDNDGIMDFCFIDESDNALKIFQLDKNGVPVTFYSHLLAQNHDEIIVDDFYQRRKTFYCYSKEMQLIEAVRVNFRNGKFIHQKLYSPGKLKDVAVKRIDSSLVDIYMLYNKLNKLYPGKFEHRELSTTFKEYPLIDRNVINAEIVFNGMTTEQGGLPAAYYWKQTEDSLFLNKALIREGSYFYKGFFGLPKYVNASIILAVSDDPDKGKYSMITFFNSGINAFASLFTGDNYKIVYPALAEIVIDSLNYKRIFFDRFGKNGVVIYLPKIGWFYKMRISRDGKKYNLIPLVEAENVADYFIDKFDKKNSHLIYSNKKEGCISVIPLKN